MLEFPLINSVYIAGASLSHSSAGRQLAWQQRRAESQNNTKREQQEGGLFTAREVVSCAVLTPTANCVSSIVALLAPSLLLTCLLLFCPLVGFSSFPYASVFCAVSLPFCFFRFTCLRYLLSAFISAMFISLTVLVSRYCFNSQDISYHVAQQT